MKAGIKKIVIIGPESTGKSTLAKQLAEHYNTLWVPEFAREYLERKGRDYNYDDLLTIAKGQIDLEESYQVSVFSRQSSAEQNDTSRGPKSEDRRLFIDTDMYVMKVWCEYAFHKCHVWILS